MSSTSQKEFSITYCKSQTVTRWLVFALSEAVTAWKHFSTHYAYIPCSNELAKMIKSENSCGIRERMDMYLNSYERFLKPTVHQFDLGYSYAIIMTVYYYFQYLHQISRIYALFLTGNQVDRLKNEHQEFIQDTDMFVTGIALQRTLIGSLPFDGQWLFTSDLESGILVPSRFYYLKMTAQYNSQIPFKKVSLYYFNPKPQEEEDSPRSVRLLVVDQKYLELTIHTVRTDWDQAWLERFVKRLSTLLSTKEGILTRIYSLN